MTRRQRRYTRCSVHQLRYNDALCGDDNATNGMGATPHAAVSTILQLQACVRLKRGFVMALGAG